MPNYFNLLSNEIIEIIYNMLDLSSKKGLIMTGFINYYFGVDDFNVILDNYIFVDIKLVEWINNFVRKLYRDIYVDVKGLSIDRYTYTFHNLFGYSKDIKKCYNEIVKFEEKYGFCLIKKSYININDCYDVMLCEKCDVLYEYVDIGNACNNDNLENVCESCSIK